MDPLGSTDSTAGNHTTTNNSEDVGEGKTGLTPPTICTTNNMGIKGSTEEHQGNAVADQPSITSITNSVETTSLQERAATNDTARQQPITDSTTGTTAHEMISQGMDHPNLPEASGAMVESHADPEGASLHHLAADGPHPDAAAIIRQVEYYLSDENLPTDAHMLSFTGADGADWVSVNRIFGFAKMRGYKPKAKAKAALRGSTVLEVDENLKFVKRRTPLSVPAKVQPKQSEDKKIDMILQEKPWLTKGMLKPTGFEEGFMEGPLKPEEHEMDRKMYDPNEAFAIRIDRAVAKYMSKRKMHQDTLSVFSKFLTFGGFDGTAKQFTGGLSQKDLEDYDKDEILDMKASFGVSDHVFDGLDEDQEGGANWVVDFEGMAKAFFSSHLLQSFEWMDRKVTDNATNVLSNFFNYLLYHQVCPEYKNDIVNARKICDIARQELATLATAARNFPGNFNTASSTMFGGYYAMRRPSNPKAEWVNPDDDMGWSDAEAKAIWHTALTAHCSSEDYKQFEEADDQGTLTSVEGHRTGLEVLEVQYPTEQVKWLYNCATVKQAFVQPTGTLICKRWIVPGASALDIPEEMIASREAKMPQQYEFLVEEDVLRSCCPGMKLDATVAKFNVGDLSYIDAVHYVYPSFYTWTLNERIQNYTHSGPPTEWMLRKNSAEDCGSEIAESEGDGVRMVEHVNGGVVDGGEEQLNGEAGDGMVNGEVGGGGGEQMNGGPADGTELVGQVYEEVEDGRE